jgi:hypothetical protein
MAAVLEDAVEDGLGEVGMMEDMTRGGKRLVRGEEHKLAAKVAAVDHLEDAVDGVVGEREVAELVDDDDVRVEVVVERGLEAAGASGVGEALDELGGGGEAGLEAVVDRAVGDRDREGRLAGVGGPGQDDAARPSATSSGPRSKPRSWRLTEDWKVKVEVLDQRDEGDLCLEHGTLDAGLGAVCRLLGEEDGQVVAVAELLLLGPGLAQPRAPETEARCWGLSSGG